jgi:hypothetical protein
LQEKREEKKKKKKRRKGYLAEIHLNFKKYKNAKKEVVMVCSNGFYNWYKPFYKFSEFLNKWKRGFGEVLINEERCKNKV